MSSDSISQNHILTLQRIARYRKFVRILTAIKREEKISQEDIEFLGKLSFSMANDLINGVHIEPTPRPVVLGDMTIEPRLMATLSLSNSQDIYF